MILHTVRSHRQFCNLSKKEYPYSITENGVTCDRCTATCMLSLDTTGYTQRHIEKKHKLNKVLANKLKIWVNKQLDIIKKCEDCEQFGKLDIFNLMVHLFEVHNVTVPPKFIPKGTLSPRLYNLFHRDRNTADIPTSSSNQLPTCNTLRTDVDNLCSDLNPDSAVESTEEVVHDLQSIDIVADMSDSEERNTADIPTSSSNQLPTCNTLRTYVDNFCSDLHSDSAVESTEEDVTGNLPDIAPSSSLLSADTAEDLPNVQASWMWYYLRTDMKNAICNICNNTYKLHYIRTMRRHTVSSHWEFCDLSKRYILIL
ncbi:uncharacterized protein LOC114938338 isoform X2 [Nylanderia fulva]|uniref:uncharacterized protein LOC114938338 isoform X2 n=1 Tax=Nylanderia fulva TaxID=613905 RepID=UPI0010FBB1CF|nr:uncharacterized protein LOC114938338 isoform X2 [Nylanderia fulva]